MLHTFRPPFAPSEFLSIMWWRSVIAAARRLNRLAAWLLPVLAPLRPYWWVPVPFSFLGFVVGLGAALILG